MGARCVVLGSVVAVLTLAVLPLLVFVPGPCHSQRNQLCGQSLNVLLVFLFEAFLGHFVVTFILLVRKTNEETSDRRGRWLCKKVLWYTGLLVAIALWISMLFSAVWANISQSHINEAARTWLWNNIKEYGNTSSEIDSVQGCLSCCGVDSPKDWQSHDIFNCSLRTGVCGVPPSCCNDQSNASCGFDIWQNGTLSSNVSQSGCVDKCDKEGNVILIVLYWVFVLATTIYDVILVRSQTLRNWVGKLATEVLLAWKTLSGYCINSGLALCRRKSERIDCESSDQGNSDDIFLVADDSSSVDANLEAAERNDSADTWSSKACRLLCLCYCLRKRFRSSQPSQSDCHRLLDFEDQNSSDSEDNPVQHRQTDFSMSEDHGAETQQDLSPLCTVDSRPPPEQPLEHVVMHRGAQTCSVVGHESKINTGADNDAVVVSEPELLIFDMDAALKELEEDIQTVSAENNQLSATVSEDGSKILPLSELSLDVGSGGGSAYRGDMSLFVPPGAVDRNVTLFSRLHTDRHRFPLVDNSKDEFIFSPVFSLEPHGYRFKQPVLVRCPFTAVPGGWQLILLRAECRETQAPRIWEEIVTYNTDTGEVKTTDCDFDVDRALLGVTHFCDLCWYGKFLVSSLTRSITGRKQLFCSVFGCQSGRQWDRWLLEVIFHDRCKDIFEDIRREQNQKRPRGQLLSTLNTLQIARDGNIRCEFLSRSWQLEEPMESIPFQCFWNEWFGNRHSLSFAVELQPGHSMERAYEIKITVFGCADSVPVKLIVLPPMDEPEEKTFLRCYDWFWISLPQGSPTDYGYPGSEDSGRQSGIEYFEGLRHSRSASSISTASPMSPARMNSHQAGVEWSGYDQASITEKMERPIPGMVPTESRNTYIFNIQGANTVVAGSQSSLAQVSNVRSGQHQLGPCGDGVERRQLAAGDKEAFAQIASSENLGKGGTAEDDMHGDT